MSRRSASRAARALAHLPERDPALAALALWCDLRDRDAPDCVTTDDVVHVGTALGALPLHEQIGVVGRHVLFVALRHEVAMGAMAERLGDGFDAGLFALCAEAHVNECLLRGGHALPRPAVRLSELLELSGVDEHGAAGDTLATWGPERLYLHATDGSGEHAQRFRDYARARGFRPALHPGRPDPDAGRRAVDWRARILRALRGGGGAGRGIGQILRRIEQGRSSGVPWDLRLRGLMARALAEVPRQTWQRPRSGWIAAEADAVSRNLPRPVFQPASQRRSLLPRIAIGLDTSSSIGEGPLSRLGAEIAAISRRVAADTHVLCFDEEVYLERRLDPVAGVQALADLPMRRDGGTSFVDLMRRADALSPSVIVVLSDAEGVHGPRPRAPVIWASPLPMRRAPPYGEVIDLGR